MHEDFEQLEDALRELRPRSIRNGFREGVQKRLAATPPPVVAPVWSRLLKLAAALAILAGGAFLLWPRREAGSELGHVPRIAPPVVAVAPRSPGRFIPRSAATAIVRDYSRRVPGNGIRPGVEHTLCGFDVVEWQNDQNGNRIRVVRPRVQKVYIPDTIL